MLTNAFFKTRTDGKELSNSSMVGRSSETEFTVSLWGFPSGLTQTYGQGIYTINGSFYDTNNPGGIFRIFIFPGGGVKVQTGAGGVGGQLILGDANSPIEMNKWFHLMLVLENNTLNIFVNGQDKTSLATVTGTISTMPSLLNGAYKNYMLGYYNSTTYSWQGSLVHVAQWDSDKSSDISTIYNNGKPGDLTSLSPKNWWKLTDGSLVDSGSEADNAVALSTLPTIVATNVNSNSNPGTSLGMTEANLIDENVSVVNGESDTLPASALVQSDLTRKLPFSNYSITFDGTADYFSINSSGALDTFHANPFSISLWFKYTGGTRVLVTKQETASASTQVVYIYTNAGNILWYGGGVSPSATSSGGLSDGNWHHAVFVAESDTVARIYIDGVDDTADIAKDRIGTGSNTGSIILGTNYNKDNFFFNGEMSNAAIWTSALTPEEILDLYNNGIPTNLNTSFTPGPPNYWWPMDEDYTYFNGSVLVARDAVGSNDGTGVNIIQENIVGNAPGSEANGIGTNLTITDLKGDMKSSINNSYSINMADYADGVTNPANSGRSTNVP
jgi:hypothetical protein